MRRLSSRFAVLLFAFGLLLGGICGVAVAAQGHMDNAIGYLQSARSQLNQAVHDKGGHRANAVKLINEAIQEVNYGIQAGDQ